MRATVILCLLAAAVTAGDEVFKNGGFESGAADWRALNMSGQCVFEADAAEKAAGKTSLRITRTGGGRPDWLKQFVDLKSASGSVTVTVHFKVAEGKADVTFGFYGADGEFVGKGMAPLLSSGPTRGFESVTRTFRVPRSAKGCGMNVMITQPSTLWLDGISVQHDAGAVVPAGEEEIFVNGDFEAGFDGWRPLNMSGSATFRADQGVKAGGAQSVYLERKAKQPPYDWLKQFVELPGKEGTVKVTLAYRVKGKSDAKINFGFTGADGEFVGKGMMNVVRLKKKSSKFKTVEQTFKIPKRATGCGMNIRLEGDCSFWVDEIKVVYVAPKGRKKKKKKTPKAPLTLKNGDFERSIAGWRRVTGRAETAKASHDRAVFATRKGSLRLQRGGHRLRPEDGVAIDLDLESEASRALLTFSARVESPARGVVALIAFDEAGAPLGASRVVLDQGTDGFSAHRLALPLPEFTESVRVVLAIQGAGTVWFDDVVVEGK